MHCIPKQKTGFRVVAVSVVIHEPGLSAKGIELLGAAGGTGQPTLPWHDAHAPVDVFERLRVCGGEGGGGCAVSLVWLSCDVPMIMRVLWSCACLDTASLPSSSSSSISDGSCSLASSAGVSG